MSSMNISQVLAIIIWIVASTIPIATSTENLMSEQETENGSTINCPQYCICTNVHLTCTEMIDDTFSVQGIENFSLEKKGDVKLDLNDFSLPGLDHVNMFIISHGFRNYSSKVYDSFPLAKTTDDIYTGSLEIHRDIFKNKEQLSVLVIQEFKNFFTNSNMTKEYLFDAPSVKHLYFSVLNHEPWSSSTFTKMQNLIEVNLVSTKFIMAQGIFAPLRELILLNIKRADNWNHIGRNDFVDIPKIRQLHIGNNIKTIHEDAFLHLPELEILNISYNKIESFTERHLRNNQKLEKLDMSYNEDLKLLPVFKLNSSVGNNYNIREFKCEHCGLESITDGTFDAMPFLGMLNLGGNRLKTLPQGFFKPLTSLVDINLDNNLISNIPANMFEGANKLEFLVLNGNPITTLDLTPFLAAPVLKALGLGHCQLESWISTNKSHDNLEYLSIENNKLKHIAAEDFETLPKMRYIKLMHNPIKCKEVEDIKRWTLSHKVKTGFHDADFGSCSPDKISTCWDKLTEVMCSAEYISKFLTNELKHEMNEMKDEIKGEIEKMKDEMEKVKDVLDKMENVRDESVHDASEKTKPGSAPSINQSIITSIMIIATIAFTLRNDSQTLFL